MEAQADQAGATVAGPFTSEEQGTLAPQSSQCRPAWVVPCPSNLSSAGLALTCGSPTGPLSGSDLGAVENRAGCLPCLGYLWPQAGGDLSQAFKGTIPQMDSTPFTNSHTPEAPRVRMKARPGASWPADFIWNQRHLG